ncbi:MAG: aminotransferase class IV [Agarilytica sp.]
MASQSKSSFSFSLVDGKTAASANLNDRGLTFGDGLFETLHYQRGCVPLLQYHLARLRADCDRLKFNLDEAALQLGLQQIYSDLSESLVDEARIKVLVTRVNEELNSGSGGSYPSRQSSVRLYFYINEYQSFGDRSLVALRTSPVCLPDFEPLAGIKHTNRLPYIYGALQENCTEGQELLFLDARNNIIESMHHNVFFVRGNTLVTPLIKTCGVRGVMRGLTLDRLAKDAGFQAEEKLCNQADIEHYDGLILSNALHGFTTAGSVDGTELKSHKNIQEICGRLNTALENLKSQLRKVG